MGNIDVRFLFEMPFVVAFRPGPPAGEPDKVTWGDLSDQPLIWRVGQYTQVLDFLELFVERMRFRTVSLNRGGS